MALSRQESGWINNTVALIIRLYPARIHRWTDEQRNFLLLIPFSRCLRFHRYPIIQLHFYSHCPERFAESSPKINGNPRSIRKTAITPRKRRQKKVGEREKQNEFGEKLQITCSGECHLVNELIREKVEERGRRCSGDISPRGYQGSL